jgi:hypothetical protein
MRALEGPSRRLENGFSDGLAEGTALGCEDGDDGDDDGCPVDEVGLLVGKLEPVSYHPLR